MVRWMVSILHGVSGVGTIVTLSYLLAQGKLNANWERAFYGDKSVMTSVIVSQSIVLMAVGALQLMAAIGWMLNWRIAGWTLLMFSVLLASVQGGPGAILYALVTLLILVELTTDRRGPPASPRTDG